MDTYFTIMIKENDSANLGLLNEKLSEGFYINERIEVGRSTVITLRKPNEERVSRLQGRYSEDMPVATNR